MDMIIIYLLDLPRFKYLDHLGANIKFHANHFVFDRFKFLKSSKIMIEATDINYLRTSTINVAASKTPQNQYSSVEKLANSTNADVEADFTFEDSDDNNTSPTTNTILGKPNNPPPS
ncbi:30758_t:CDS:2, partial [Gigaspora margarita]